MNIKEESTTPPTRPTRTIRFRWSQQPQPLPIPIG